MIDYKWEKFIENILQVNGLSQEEVGELLAERHCHCPLEEEGEEVCEEVVVNGSVVARLWLKKQYWMEAIAPSTHGETGVREG
jgi:hypothetical protein